MSKQKPMIINGNTPPDPGWVMLDQPVQFVPESLYHDASAVRKDRKAAYGQVAGVICYINRAHRYFTVTYKINGKSFKEGFKY